MSDAHDVHDSSYVGIARCYAARETGVQIVSPAKSLSQALTRFVIPAQAGNQDGCYWTPAFAGVTDSKDTV